jgi:hypothetical protein
MNASYYAMKRRLGGEKFTAREKLCWHWYPTPGCITHAEIIGKRRAEILFEKYCGSSRSYGRNANLLYWRTHPEEWAEVQRRVNRKPIK